MFRLKAIIVLIVIIYRMIPTMVWKFIILRLLYQERKERYWHMGRYVSHAEIGLF